MNVHIAIPTQAEILAREIRLGKRPQNAGKPRPVSVTAKPEEPPVASTVWQRERVWFDDHVKAHRKSSRYAKTPYIYFERRSLELGFTRKELIGDMQFLPFIFARRLIVHELSMKWGLTNTQIANLIKRDTSSVWLMLHRPRPSEEEASMRLYLPVNITYLDALERAYYDGVPYEAMSADYRISQTGIQRIARKLQWPYRRAHLTKKALQGRSISYLTDRNGWERKAEV